MTAKVAALVLPLLCAYLLYRWISRSTRKEMQNGDNIYW